MDEIMTKIGEKRNLYAHPQQNRALIFGYKFPKKNFVELAPISLNIYAEFIEVASRSTKTSVNQQ